MANEDHVLSFGFEGKDLLKGLKAIEKQLEKIDKLQQRISRNQIRGPTMGGPSGASRGRRAAGQAAIGRSRLADTSSFERTLATREATLSGFFSKTDSAAMRAELSGVITQIKAIRMEASKTSSPKGLSKLKDEYALVGVRAKQATKAINENNKALTASKFASNAAFNSLKNFGAAYLSIFTIVEGTKMFVKLQKEISAMNASLLAASGSAEAAAMDFEFLANTANTLGTDLQSSTKGFKMLAIAGRDAGMSMESIKEIFTSLSEANTTFALDQQNSERVFKAVTQMLSKQNVMAEELKGQLGDALPVALSASARAMGTTVPEFMKLMEQGKILANDFLPKLAKELSGVARSGGALEAAMSNVVAQQNRFSTARFLFAKNASETGAEEGLANVYKSLAQAFTDVFGTGQSAGKRFKFLGKALSGIITLLGDLLSPIAAVGGWMVDILAAASASNEELKETRGSVLLLGAALRPLINGFKVISDLIRISLNGLEGMMEIAKNLFLGKETLVDAQTGAVIGERDFDSPLPFVGKDSDREKLWKQRAQEQRQAMGDFFFDMFGPNPATTAASTKVENNIAVNVQVDGSDIPSRSETTMQKVNAQSMGSM